MSLNILAIPLTYLDFKLRQDYYANVLCQNQDQPIAVCGGRCFVDKQMALMQSTETQPLADESIPVSPTLIIDLSVYIAAASFHFGAIHQIFTSSLNTEMAGLLPSGSVASVFHPPQS